MDAQVKNPLDNQQKAVTERNYGIDLLRMVSMFMVVVLHILGVGGILANVVPFSLKYCTAWILEIAAYCAVNCYAVISGYVGYGSKPRYSGIVNLSFQVLFYTAAITFCGFLLSGRNELWEIKTSLLSAISGNYWYFTAYFCAFFFFPYINILMDNLSNKQAKSLVVTLFVLFSVIPAVVNNDIFKTVSGYGPLWVIIMYIFGAYIKKTGMEKGKKPLRYFMLYIAFVLITFASMAGVSMANNRFGIIRDPAFLVTYTSPFIVMTGICLFIVFVNLKINKSLKKVIKFMSPLTFGVYLTHTQYYSWAYITNRFVSFALSNSLYLLGCVLCTALIIYVIGSLADFIRTLIFRLLRIKKLSAAITRRWDG